MVMCVIPGQGNIWSRIIKSFSIEGGVWLAPSEERVTLGLGVVSLSPTLAVEINKTNK